MTLWVILCIVLLLLGMGGVAFVTLLERKLLGLSQIRLGPNKVSLMGLLQPLADGVKLLLKEVFYLKSSQSLIFITSPAMLMLVFMVVWVWIVPWWGDLFFMKYSSLLFFSLLGVGAYTVILVGWSSLSAFSKLGSLRGMLQSLSFEVALILVFLVVLLQFDSFSINAMNNICFQEHYLFWGVIWFILSLMETNRAPFDLLEGESELISGFNIEMGSLPFVFLFLSEYGMILVVMIVMVICLFYFSVYIILLVSFLLFMRSCFPRVRYDMMMGFMWLVVLPVSILLFLLTYEYNS